MNPVTNHRTTIAVSTNKCSNKMFCNGMNRRGFTIIELVIVITIMGILLTLGVVNLRGSQANGRDAERKVDIETIAQHLETYYTGGTESATALDYCESSGDTVTHDGLYTVHKFTTAGATTLTCPGTISVEVLVVGGGGGGGSFAGGGGGGGVVYNPSFVVAPQAYPVTVGGGGAGTTAGSDSGVASASGDNSVFSTITATGGGGGGTRSSSGRNGGSGGGASPNDSVFQVGGLASPAGQGYNGGSEISPGWGGSGGGGAGGIGAGGIGNNGGNGGVGIANPITGSTIGQNVSGTYYLAGGGGGGTYRGDTGSIVGSGGNGGGGGGTKNSTNGVAGTANSGGGGGGSDYQYIGGAGGSGVVIVRYLTPNGLGTYPSTLFLGTLTSIKLALRDVDPDSLIAPGLAVVGDDDTAMAAHVASTFIAATDGTILTNASPHPTKDEYVYQPLHSDGSLCNDTAECRKFNLYYRQEVDSNVIMVTSLNQ